MTNAPSGAAIRRAGVLGCISRVLNRAMGGARGQTLCARMAARNPNCLFCRMVAHFTEPNHCANELAAWQRRGTGAAVRLREQKEE